MNILKISHLTKKYGRITAVNDLSISVEQGQIFGLLGPNGSGKTTTLGIVLGITHTDSGTFEWFEGTHGENPRRQIGALLETPNFYPYLNAVQNLEITAHIKQVKQPNIDEVLEIVKLSNRKTSLFRTYSLGMKQRLAIAATMIGDPDVLIFDEPTNGLDPIGIAEVRDTLLQIAQRGKTIIMASHILDEVEKICSHVAIIQSGRLLADGTVGAILSGRDNKTDEKLHLIEIAAKDMTALQDFLKNLDFVRRVEAGNQHFLIQCLESYSTAEINHLAFNHGITLTHLLTRKRRLEEEFLEITKGKTVD